MFSKIALSYEEQVQFMEILPFSSSQLGYNEKSISSDKWHLSQNDDWIELVLLEDLTELIALTVRIGKRRGYRTTIDHEEG